MHLKLFILVTSSAVKSDVYRPGIIATIYTPSTGEKLSSFKARENILFFLGALQRLGIFAKFQGFFTVSDLVEGDGISRVVDTISLLGKNLSKDGAFGFPWEAIRPQDINMKKGQ